MAVVVSIQTGRVAPLGPKGVRSAFVKHPVAGPVRIGTLGLEGDEQALPGVHGGVDKAVYGYAAESYAVWRQTHPAHAALWGPGAVGENLTTEGFDEDTLCIGDTLAIGTAVLQITQPREPCSRLALRFSDPLLPKAMVRNGLSGWYMRVLKPGVVTAGDAARVVASHNPGWSVSRMNRFITAKPREPALAASIAQLTGVAEAWRARLTPAE